MRILLAIDGSKYSEAAIQAVASRMRPQGAEVVVLQVVESLVFSTPPQMSPGYAPETAAKQAEPLRQAKESVAHAAEVLRAAGFAVNTRVVEDEIRTAILDVAAGWHADLIVLGSHGRKGLERLLLGSVSEAVVRHASCSVLIVRTLSAY